MTDIPCTIEIINNGQWITPLAIILSASIGAWVARSSIKHQREIAKMRATLDVILESESNTYYQKIYSSFRSESKRTGGLMALANAKSDSERESRRNLNDFMNHYELIAIAINKKILDEKFYKTWMRSTYIKHFDQCKDYIYTIRNEEDGNEKYFREFEVLAERWRDPACKCE